MTPSFILIEQAQTSHSKSLRSDQPRSKTFLDQQMEGVDRPTPFQTKMDTVVGKTQ